MGHGNLEELDESLEELLRSIMGMDRAYVMLLSNLHDERCAVLQMQRDRDAPTIDPVPEYTEPSTVSATPAPDSDVGIVIV
jgi:hypothetical protein